MTRVFEIRDVAEQPALFIAATCRREDIGARLMEIFPEVFRAMERFGVSEAGAPFCRYVTHAGDEIDIEAGIPVNAVVASGDLRVLAGSLGGCTTAFTIHRGPYSQMGETYAALERWILEQGRLPRDGRWASYVTDPSEFPDPENWMTEVYWPV
jgi:effector-binding domain-containing protein